MRNEEVDREIERALAVDPSPEFTARVRTRIASEPAPSMWPLSWRFAAAGVAIAAIVFAIAVSRPKQDVAQGQNVAQGLSPAKDTARGSTSSPRAGEVPPEAVQQSAWAAHSPLILSPSKDERHGSDPEILIDPREAMALQRLIAGVRDGRVDLSPVLRASTPAAMELPPVSDLVIAPLTIEPLAPVEGAEGVRQ